MPMIYIFSSMYQTRAPQPATFDGNENLTSGMARPIIFQVAIKIQKLVLLSMTAQNKEQSTPGKLNGQFC